MELTRDALETWQKCDCCRTNKSEYVLYYQSVNNVRMCGSCKSEMRKALAKR